MQETPSELHNEQPRRNNYLTAERYREVLNYELTEAERDGLSRIELGPVDRAILAAADFNRKPPVWATILAGVIVLFFIQFMRFAGPF